MSQNPTFLLIYTYKLIAEQAFQAVLTKLVANSQLQNKVTSLEK